MSLSAATNLLICMSKLCFPSQRTVISASYRVPEHSYESVPFAASARGTGFSEAALNFLGPTFLTRLTSSFLDGAMQAKAWVGIHSGDSCVQVEMELRRSDDRKKSSQAETPFSITIHLQCGH